MFQHSGGTITDTGVGVVTVGMIYQLKTGLDHWKQKSFIEVKIRINARSIGWTEQSTKGICRELNRA